MSIPGIPTRIVNPAYPKDVAIHDAQIQRDTTQALPQKPASQDGGARQPGMA